VPDTRSHRGARQEDRAAFAPAQQVRLQTACAELSWLLTRGYSEGAALTLVGDHHQLTLRQRQALRRASCTDEQRTDRRSRRVQAANELSIDGFNCLITVESMLSRAPIFVGRDGALRDLASVHGTYRKVEETLPALAAMRDTLEQSGVMHAEFFLDRPVGNSGRLRAIIQQVFAASACTVEVSLHDAVDPVLVQSGRVAASSDSWILDRARAWLDLPAAVARVRGLEPWLVDLAGSADAQADFGNP
jgi:hypothetical protein